MKVIESREGHTSHNFNPWFAVDDGSATEQHGRVWFGAIAWSGNWRISVEQTPYRQVRVVGGLNTFDFSYPLKPGESFNTPEFYGGFSDHGTDWPSVNAFHRGFSRPRSRFSAREPGWPARPRRAKRCMRQIKTSLTVLRRQMAVDGSRWQVLGRSARLLAPARCDRQRML